MLVAASGDPHLVRQVLGTMPLIRPVPGAFADAMITESVKVPAGIWRTALAELPAAVPPTETVWERPRRVADIAAFSAQLVE